MKKFYTLLVLVFLALQIHAQHLQVQQEAGKLYLQHTVQPKENWYSVGRMYNLSPSVIASANGLKMDKGLSIGQKLKIPLNGQNLAQQGQPLGDEAFIPLHHTVKEKEGLYRIGQTYNKVTADQLKAWNKLKSDDVVVGSSLVVGYLRVKKDLSPLAGAAVLPPATTPATKPAETAKVAPAEEKPAPVTKPTEEKPAPTVTKPVEEKPAPVTKPAEEKPATVTPPPAPVVRNDAPTTEGAFAGAFKEQSKGNNQVAGTAAIFKSTSGWKDGKYYVLMNKVAPGTIIRITAVGTNKIVYAKVLGEIPPGKENEGLLIRISNAASAQLQVADGARFDVQLVY